MFGYDVKMERLSGGHYRALLLEIHFSDKHMNRDPLMWKHHTKNAVVQFISKASGYMTDYSVSPSH